jgi:lactoylglutathione lyase
MRILHTMLRVTNMDESINFYSTIFGMELLRKTEFPDGKFTLAFLGYGDESANTVLELTHNWETDSYEMGNAYGHLAIAVDDAYKACDEISAKGGEVVRPAGPMMHGTTVIAFVKDPDGYMIELIQGK